MSAMKGFLLVFDLDGTLVDSVPDLHAALNEMLRERGPPAVVAAGGKAHGRRRRAGARRARSRGERRRSGRGGLGIAPLPARSTRRMRRELTRPYPGVPETLGSAAPPRLPHGDLHQQAAARDDRGAGGP